MISFENITFCFVTKGGWFVESGCFFVVKFWVDLLIWFIDSCFILFWLLVGAWFQVIRPLLFSSLIGYYGFLIQYLIGW